MYKQFIEQVQKATITSIAGEAPEFMSTLKHPGDPMANMESLSLWGMLVSFANPSPNGKKTSGVCVAYRKSKNKYVASRVCGVFEDKSIPDVAVQWKNGKVTAFCLSEPASRDWKAFLRGKLGDVCQKRKDNLLDLPPMEDPERVKDRLLKYEMIKGDGTEKYFGDVTGIVGKTKEDIPEMLYDFLEIDEEFPFNKTTMVSRTFKVNIPEAYVTKYAIFQAAINVRTERKDAEDELAVARMSYDAEIAQIQAAHDEKVAALRKKVEDDPEYKKAVADAAEAQRLFDEAKKAFEEHQASLVAEDAEESPE